MVGSGIRHNLSNSRPSPVPHAIPAARLGMSRRPILLGVFPLNLFIERGEGVLIPIIDHDLLVLERFNQVKVRRHGDASCEPPRQSRGEFPSRLYILSDSK